MPSNTFITPADVTREILPFLANERVFSRNIFHRYDSRFDASGAPKIGAQLEIRLPARFTTRSGNTMSVQGITDQTSVLTLADPIGIDLDISTIDWTLSIDDFRTRYGQSMASQISNEMDYTFLASSLGAYFSVGTPGTTPGTAAGESSLKIWMDAKTALLNVGVPDDGNIHALGTPSAIGQTAVGLSTLYNPKNTISEQYRRGIIVDALGLIFNKSQNVRVLTTGDRAGTVTINADASQGDTEITVTGMTGTLNEGEVIELGGTGYPINHVNYQTRDTIPNPRTGAYGTAQFVVTEAVTSTGSGDDTVIKISPALIAPVATVKQQYQTVDVLPTTSMQVNYLGTASSSYPQNLVYHRDAFAAAFAKLWIPPGESYNDTVDGINMRYWQQGDIMSNSALSRIDVLGACILALSERCVRVWG